MSNILTIVRGDASNIVFDSSFEFDIYGYDVLPVSPQPVARVTSVNKYDYWEPGVGGDWRENLVVSGKILTKTVTNYVRMYEVCKL